MMPPFLFPAPRFARIQTRHSTLQEHRLLVCSQSWITSLYPHLLSLKTHLESGLGYRFGITAAKPAAGNCYLQLSHDPHNHSSQGYTLAVRSAGISVTAADAAGAFYALQTLRQLIASSPSPAMLPLCTIKDAPDFTRRGFMLDISRCKVPTMQNLFSLVELLARLKYNQLQLYTEHTFRFSRHSTVWKGCSPLTPEQILRLDRHCQKHFIELVPNFNSFGHFERWLRHSRYAALAECPDGFIDHRNQRWNFGRTLSPDTASLDFLDELYDELLPNFSSSLFHAGCDETWELGRGKSAARVRQRGQVAVYTDYVRELYKRISSRNRGMMIWADMLLKEPDHLDRIPSDLTLAQWGYEANHPFAEECSRIATSGHSFYVCPGTSSWTAISGRYDNCIQNIKRAAAEGLRTQAEGLLLTDWGDHGHHQYRPISYPGIIAAAANAWCHSKNRSLDIDTAVNHTVFDNPKSFLGPFLHSFGNLYTCIRKKQVNSTHFHHFLFLPFTKLTLYVDDIPLNQIAEAQRQRKQLEKDFLQFSVSSNEERCSYSQLRNALSMCELALHRAWCAKKSASLPDDTHTMLLRIRQAHARSWRLRNRSGGLAESMAWFKNVI